MVIRYALLHIFFLLSLAVAPPSNATTTTKPGCHSSCGNVEIPYPFGIGPNCSENSYFNILCNTSFDPPKPYLSSVNNSYLEVVNISKSQIYVKNSELQLARTCYGMRANYNTKNNSIYLNFSSTPYTLSDANQLTAVGCDDMAMAQQISGIIHENGGIGCLPYCQKSRDVGGMCPGVGCCQTSISKTVVLKVQPVDMHDNWEKERKDFRCSFAFVGMNGDLGSFPFKLSDLDHPTAFLKNNKKFMDRPLVLDWRIDPFSNCNQTSCGKNSSCINLDGGNGGYHCRCKEGYEGNPYLGCQDIDECNNNPCDSHGICSNNLGSYNCRCSNGYYGDGKKNGTGCRLVPVSHSKVTIGIGFGSGLGLLLLLSTCFWLYKFHKKRKNKNRKQKFFKRNGGLLLQQQISSDEGILQKTRLFTSKELERATDRFNENRILGKGSQGTVYKGMLSDGKIVAIKKSISIDENQVGKFINEVVMLSQIIHRNVVKLLGCCLETEVPLLVYEFISNGTLFDHIHDESDEFPFSWNRRLKIAVEVAEALAYLHSATSIPIYHRDIKSSNILLDEKYVAKVADFGISMSIAVDQTHQTTLVKGTFGYLDPEYFQSSQFTEKSDVYSFGVVLIELLTGQRPISFDKIGEQRSLATRFLLCMEEKDLETILDTQVLKRGNREELIAVAKVAQRCLNLNGKKRPTMKEVAIELENVTMSQTLSTTFETKYEDVQLQKSKSISNDDYIWTSTSDNTVPSHLSPKDSHSLIPSSGF